MTNVDLLFDQINSGREGKNIGLKTGIPLLDKYTGGIQKGTYTLVFGLSGSGNVAYLKIILYICIIILNKILWMKNYWYKNL